MKQIFTPARYLAIVLTLAVVFAMPDRDQTGLQTRVAAGVSDEPSFVNMGGGPVHFEENRGQFDERVKYFLRGARDHSMFLTATDAVYVLTEKPPASAEMSKALSPVDAKSSPKTRKPSKAVAVYMTLVGADQNSEYSGLQPLEHRTNYFKGSDESKWRTDIPNYQSVRANQVYEGIDMIWHGKDKGDVQFDFVVQPNAKPNQIEWKIQGAKNVEITAEGDLLIKTEYGAIKQNKPFTYQEKGGLRAEVESRYIVEPSKAENDGSENSFRIKLYIGDYSPATPLIIDPTVDLSDLSYSTFLGGADTEAGTAIETDDAGNVYVTGYTASTAFPTTPGTFDTSQNFGYDVFVTKLNATGSSLVYSTFLGGSSDDLGYSIAVDSSGNAFVTGFTFSGVPDYPTTAGAFDTTQNGDWDLFVTKLNPTGSSLVYSTFLGGNGRDEGFGIAVDSSGNAFVTGFTFSGTPDYPTTPGAFDTTQNGSNDAFITKLNAAGSALVYSTFVGGNGQDAGFAVAVDSSGNAFMTGYAFSANYPTTAGSFDTTHNGGPDVYVTKLNAAGSSLVYSTFLGGSHNDVGFSVVLDSAGNAFVTGQTTDDTTDFPTTAGAFDTTHNGFVDVFVTKLNVAGSSLAYSTFLGGSNDDFGEGIALDSSGNAFVTGNTNSPDYPTTAGAFDTTHNGGDDAVATKLNATGSSPTFSTFLGGSSTDSGYGIALDSLGNVSVTGRTSGGTPVFPTTAGAFDTTHNGGFDVFVTKLGGTRTPFDFDGDGKTDISIFRPGSGEWWYLKSSTGGNAAAQFGTSTDKVTPGDFTGDGKSDFAFWRPSTGFWFVLRSEDFSFFSFPFGTTGDVPLPADYDADGIADAAVYRPSNSTWFINRSSGGTTITTFGTTGDLPVASDYDGDGRADIAIFRPGGANGAEWWIQRSTAGLFATVFGASTDKAVAGDYTGDGKTDIAVWRPSTGFWYVLRSEDLSFYAFPWGANGDIPAPGDYDGDGKYDASVFRSAEATWYVNRSTAGPLITAFGANGDRPIPNAFVP